MEVQVITPHYERWERLDGVIYDMPEPPTSEHQSIVGNLFATIHSYLKSGTCKVFLAPFGVWLDGVKNGDYVEPDLTVICDPTKIHKYGCVGVPDLVVEVLSPATALKDKRTKLKRYRRSGVREYWMVDPSNQVVEVFRLSENVSSEPLVYGKNESVQVGIFDDLEINLIDVFE